MQINMQINLTSKKSLRLFKVFLVSPQLEKAILIVSITCFIILSINFDYSDVDVTGGSMKNYFENNYLLSQFYSLSEPDQLLSFAIAAYNHTFHQDSLNTKDTFNSFRLLCSPKFTQYKVNYSSLCSNISAANQMASKCNPYSDDSLLSMMLKSFNPANVSLCLSANCQEFQLQSLTEVYQLSNMYIIYPNKAFLAEIKFNKSSDFEQLVKNLLRNQWLNTIETRMVSFQLMALDQQTNRLINNIFILENWLGVSQLSYKSDIIALKVLEYSSNLIIIVGLFLVACFLQAMKIIFECNIFYRPTQVVELVATLIETGFCFLFLTEYSLIKDIQLQGRLTPNTQESCFDSSSLIILQHVRLIFGALVNIILPFKFFTLISWIQFIESFLQKFTNIIYRTLYSVLRVLLVLGIMYFCWCIAIYIGLREIESNFSTFSESLLSFFLYESAPQSNGENYFQRTQDSQYIFPIIIAVLLCMRIILVIQLFIIIAISIQHSSDFELNQRSPFQISSLETMNETIKHVDKFSKITNKKAQKQIEYQQDKMFIWLNLHLLTESEQNQLDSIFFEEQIKVLPFETAEEVFDFVKVLFQLRPNLLYKSGHYFRILLEYDMNCQDYYVKINTFKHIEYFLQLLNDKGSSVPVQIYSLQHMHDYDIIRFKKIYPLINFASNFNTLKQFALLYNVKELKKNTETNIEDNFSKSRISSDDSDE